MYGILALEIICFRICSEILRINQLSLLYLCKYSSLCPVSTSIYLHTHINAPHISQATNTVRCCVPMFCSPPFFPSYKSFIRLGTTMCTYPFCTLACAVRPRREKRGGQPTGPPSAASFRSQSDYPFVFGIIFFHFMFRACCWGWR